MAKRKTKKIKAKELLNPSRIDIIPKIWYIKNKEEIGSGFFTNMYLEHIRAFNQFNENHKKTKDDFLNDFDKLIDSIKNKGFKAKAGKIPIGNDFTAIDGAHRIASCDYFKEDVPIKQLSKSKGPDYNYNYFKKRGINLQILEEIIFRYFDYKKENLYACIFWGSSIKNFNEKKVLKELEKDNILPVYSKKVKLTSQGKLNLVISCYEDEPWMNDKGKNFSGAIRKVAPCFKGSDSVVFYLLESKSVDNIIKFKKRIREKLKIGNHSIHTSDTYQETRNLCDLFLNKNSLFFMNYGKKMILPKELDNKNLKERMDFAVTSSFILELFGIRNAEDIDYIIDSNKEIKGLNNHNYYFSKEEIKEIIYNPKNFFRFRGIKFLTLDFIKEFKKKRGEKKDRKDIMLIERFMNDKKKFNFKEKVFLIQMRCIGVFLKLIKKIPQKTRDNLKQNKFIMKLYRGLFC